MVHIKVSTTSINVIIDRRSANSNFNYEFDTNSINFSKSKFIIEERRRLVARLWAQSKSETEIARELLCNVSTILRDIKFLNKLF